MDITHENLNALRSGFKTQFQLGLKSAVSIGAILALTVPSTTKLETYGWLKDWPMWRKFVGEKRIKSLEEQSYQLSNDDYETTVGIHKNKIRDDKLGIYGPMFKGWGKVAGKLADKLIFDALKNGHSAKCFDGQYFFDTDHTVAGATVSNKSGNAANPPWFLVDLSQPLPPFIYQDRQSPEFNMVVDPEDSHVFKTGEFLAGGEARGAAGYTYWQLAHRCDGALNEANYKAAYDAMAALTDDEGEPLEVRPTHIVFGASNRSAAKTLFKAMTGASGASNIYYEDVQMIHAPRFA